MADETTELIQIETITAMDLYGAPEGLDGILAAIRKAATAVPVDMTTATGRKSVASTAFKVSRLKVHFDGLGKEMVEEWKTKAKTVDSERKRLRDTLDSLKDEIRKPLTEFEEAEKARIAGIQADIENIKSGFGMLGYLQTPPTIREMYEAADKLACIEETPDRFAEFLPQAQETIRTAQDTLHGMIERAEAAEAARIETERLRKENEALQRAAREEQIRKEAADKARREAEEAAQRRADEEARRQATEIARAKAAEDAAKRDLELSREREERAKAEAELAAKRERERIEAAEAERIAEQERREADAAHRESVIVQITADLSRILAIPLSDARKIVDAISISEIPHLWIEY